MFDHLDKVVHFGIYGVLAVLFVRLLIARGHRFTVSVGLLCLAAVTGYAILDEVHQVWIPHRQCSSWDLGADAAGAAAGLCLVYFFPRLAPRQ
jgi:VanZ family protein